MLRIFRVTGILFFALMIGVSANNLWEMGRNGELFERFNSERRTNITVMSASILAVIGFGALELIRTRRVSEERGFGGVFHEQEDASDADSGAAADIYASSKSMDQWDARHRSAHRPASHKHTTELASIWMGLLSLCCLAIPGFHIFRLVQMFRSGFGGEAFEWVVLIGYALITLLSFAMAVGIGLKRMWGYTLGYGVAICNLLVFPVGTGIGLMTLVGLVGAAPLFVEPEQKRRRQARRAQRRQLEAGV